MNEKNTVLFDTICQEYDRYRKADPEITEKLKFLLAVKPGERLLDLACGTGNYTIALNSLGLSMEGADISEHMLLHARAKQPDLLWHQCNAHALPFESDYFHGAVCVLAIHHMPELDKVFSEVARTIKTGRFVIFIHTSEQLKSYWLCHYFPKMMAQSIAKSSSKEALSQQLLAAGFKSVRSKPYHISNDLEDCFLHAGKYRPEIYLEESLRAGISTFQLAPDPSEVEQGLGHLKADIDSGEINSVIERYETTLGDYCFIIADK